MGSFVSLGHGGQANHSWPDFTCVGELPEVAERSMQGSRRVPPVYGIPVLCGNSRIMGWMFGRVVDYDLKAPEDCA
jgi:hypothetical protein